MQQSKVQLPQNLLNAFKTRQPKYSINSNNFSLICPFPDSSQYLPSKSILSHRTIDVQSYPNIKKIKKNYQQCQARLQLANFSLQNYADDLQQKQEQVDLNQFLSLGDKYQYFLRRNQKDSNKLEYLKQKYSQIDEIVNTSQPVVSAVHDIQKLSKLLNKKSPKLDQYVQRYNQLISKNKLLNQSNDKKRDQIKQLTKIFFDLQRQMKSLSEYLQNEQKQYIKKSIQSIMKIILAQNHHFFGSKQNKPIISNRSSKKQKFSASYQPNFFVDFITKFNQENNKIILTEQKQSKKNYKFSIQQRINQIKKANQIFQKAQFLKQNFLSSIEVMKNIQSNINNKKNPSQRKNLCLKQSCFNSTFQKSSQNRGYKYAHKNSMSNHQLKIKKLKIKRQTQQQLFGEKNPNTSRQIRKNYANKRVLHKRFSSQNEKVQKIINLTTFDGNFYKKAKKQLYQKYTYEKKLLKKQKDSDLFYDSFIHCAVTERQKSKDLFRQLTSEQILRKIIQRSKVEQILNLIERQKYPIAKLQKYIE